MNPDAREKWDNRFRGRSPGLPEPSLLEMLPLIPVGRALDVAAGDGCNALPLARAGFDVVAVDFSAVAMRSLGYLARTENLAIFPLIANLETAALPFRENRFDAIINIRYLYRPLVPQLKGVLRVGGILFFDTFLIDEAAFGHPSNPAFMLNHYELRELLSDMDLIRYREGLTIYSENKRAWRATALARKRG